MTRLVKHYHRYISVVFVLLALLALPNWVGLAQVKNTDTFIFDTFSSPDTLDPGWGFDTASFTVIQQVYEPLITFKGGQTDELLPVLAESFTISADGLTYTFKIRKGIKFHDGSDLTPEDVAYTFQRLLAIDRDGGSSFLHAIPLLGVGSTRGADNALRATVKIANKDLPLNEAICNAVAVQGENVVLKLAQPFAPYVQILAGGQSHIISKKFTLAQAQAQKKTEFSGCPVSLEDLKKFNNPENESKLALFDLANGTGPFKLTSWDKAQKVITLARDDNYAGNRNNGPKASFKNIIIKDIEEFTTRLLELKNGDADIILAGSRANVPQILDTENTLVVDDLPGLTVNVLNFNFDIKGDKNPMIGSAACDGKGIPRDFFRDANIRLGFAYVYDREKYIRDILLGKGIAPATPDVAGLPFHDPSIQGYKFDREKARAAFNAAKCGNQSLSAVGFTFSMRFNAGNLARQSACNLIKTDVESFNRNFHINCEGVPFSEILNQVNNGEVPSFVLGWAPDYIDDADYIDQWMGSAQHGAAYSGAGVSVDKLEVWGKPGKTAGGVEYKNWDDLLNKGIAATSNAARKDIYSHLQKLYVENVPSVPISQAVAYQPLSPGVEGWYYNPAHPSAVFPTLNFLSKKVGAKPDVNDICKNYPAATFNYGPKGEKKDCKNRP
jgi:peptide/nickel transport system substrate-binding protein